MLVVHLNTSSICKALVQEAFAFSGKWESNFARAEAMLSEAVAQEPTNALLLTCLGAVLCDQGQYERAEKVLRRGVEVGSTDRNTFFNLAVAVLNSGKHEDAMRLFAEGRKRQPSAESWEAYFDPQAH